MTSGNDTVAAARVLREKRGPIVQEMARYIAQAEGNAPTAEHGQIAGALYDAALAAFNGASPQVSLPARRSIVHFGDGLVPIVKDAAGDDLPGSSISRLSDAYWRMVNAAGPPAH